MIEQMPFGTNSFAENPEPRLPSLLLLDTSGSMGEISSNAGQDLGYTIQSDGQTYRAVSGGVQAPRHTILFIAAWVCPEKLMISFSS